MDVSSAKDEEYATLLDMSAIEVLPKVVRPLEKQLPYESRRLWESVTTRLIKKEFSDATREKVGIEQRQRDEAAERKRKGLEYVFFFLIRVCADCVFIPGLFPDISRRTWMRGIRYSRLWANRPSRRRCGR
jgi:hypothetical protein